MVRSTRSISSKVLSFGLALIMCASALYLQGVKVSAAVPQSADDYDGSDLWLRYVPVSDASLLAGYRGVVKGIYVDESKAEGLYRFADSPLYQTAYGKSGIQQPAGAEESVPASRLAAARMELKRGLDGLLDMSVPVIGGSAGDYDGAVIVGTPDSSAFIGSLRLGSALKAVGTDGYLINSVALDGGGNCTVIAANTELGALYGSFAFLRLIQTQQPISNLKISDSPKVNHRRLNGWNTERLYAATGPAGTNGDTTGGGSSTGGLPNGESGDIFNWDLSPNTAGNTAHSRAAAVRLPMILDRYIVFARACASLGINEININNVNTNTAFLTEYVIRQEAALADALRPYGVKLALSINYGQPTVAMCNETGRSVTPLAGEPTVTLPPDETTSIGAANAVNCDPYNPAYQQWWADKTRQILKRIPDFAGYTCKANSEGQSGPQTYGFTHDQGAFGIANLLQSLDVPADPDTGRPAMTGVSVPVFWRSFVYNADVDNDRLNRAYMEFGPADDANKFLPNTFVQTKNGPLDFQPREPFHPMFGRMKNTNQAIELEITKEYLGQNKSFCYLAPMWEEVFKSDTYANGPGTLVGDIIDGSAQGQGDTAIVGVHNLGNSPDFTGHQFDQANFYAFGRMAWDWTLGSEQIAREWTRMTWSNDADVVNTIVDMMMGSREAVVSYQEPFGIMHQQNGTGYGHYPPTPWDWSSQDDWGPVYYNKADAQGLGWDRTEAGRIAEVLPVPEPGSVNEKYFPLVNQYFPENRDMFANIDTCPEKYIAAFHHVPWDRVMQSGNTFWQDLVYRYQMGVQYVTMLRTKWDALKGSIDARRWSEVQDKLSRAEANAARWRDESVNYWKVQSRLDIPTDTAPLSVKIVIGGREYGGFNLSQTINPNSTAFLDGSNSPTGAAYRDYEIGVPYGTTDFTITDVIPYSADAKCVITKQAAGMADTAKLTVTDRCFFGDLQQDYSFKFVYDTSLKDIKLNGSSLGSFKPEKLNYSVFASAPPAISAETSDPAATVVVTQAAGFPGTASIVVSNNGAPSKTYTVSIGTISDGDDNFDSETLDPKWSFVREDTNNWSLWKNPGAMTITTQNGTLSGNTNTAKNILLENAPGGDWVIETKLNFSRTPSVTNEEGGIIAYTDDNNYVSLGWRKVNNATLPYNLIWTREQNGTATVATHAGGDLQRQAGPNYDQIWLRIAKKGNEYMGYYSRDGVNFKTARFYQTIGATAPLPVTMNNPITKVGVYTFNNAAATGAAGPLDAKYDYFNVTPLGDIAGSFSAALEDDAVSVSLDGRPGTSGTFILAVYKNGVLTYVDEKAFVTSDAGSAAGRFAIDLGKFTGSGYSIKAYAWDGNYMPLSGSILLR